MSNVRILKIAKSTIPIGKTEFTGESLRYKPFGGDKVRQTEVRNFNWPAHPRDPSSARQWRKGAENYRQPIVPIAG